MMNNEFTWELHLGEVSEYGCNGLTLKPKQIIKITELQKQALEMFASTHKDSDLNTVYSINGNSFKIFPNFQMSA